MKAIISDIHGNLEALLAVLEDARSYGATAVYCLGDLLGHGGPDPVECVELAMAWPVVVCGNFDRAAFLDMDGYSPVARDALLWAAGQIEAPVPTAAEAARRRAFLDGLPRKARDGDVQLVHGTPRNPLHEYVFPEDIENERKLEAVFALIDRGCFAGHTHVPGVFLAGPPYAFHAPDAIDDHFVFDGRKTLVNVGSVGQPRDGDPRACYVLLDGDTVRFRRVEYDIDTTVRKIHATPALADFLGDRLRDGR